MILHCTTSQKTLNVIGYVSLIGRMIIKYDIKAYRQKEEGAVIYFQGPRGVRKIGKKL
jgi:hypothetical protein